MTMKRIVLIAALIAGFGVCIFSGYGQNQPEQPKKLNDKIARQFADLMNEKLANAQKILDGVSRNDFDKVANNAEDLVTLSNRAEWMVLKTTTYDLHSNSFRRSA